MNISNGDAIKLLETTSLGDLARDFSSRFGDEIGTKNAVNAKLQRLNSSQPKVKKYLPSTLTGV